MFVYLILVSTMDYVFKQALFQLFVNVSPIIQDLHVNNLTLALEINVKTALHVLSNMVFKIHTAVRVLLDSVVTIVKLT